MLPWAEVESEFTHDGSLRDIYVHGTDLSDWERLIKRLRTSYVTQWSVDGVLVAPMTAEECFLVREQSSVVLSVLDGGLLINCHFFTQAEIEFDLDPRDVREENWPSLVSFLRLLAATTRKDALITAENLPEDIIATFEPPNAADF